MDVPHPVEERIIWTGSPSQWINFRAFLLSGIGAIVLAVAMAATLAAGPGSLSGLQTQALILLSILLLGVILFAGQRYLDVRSRTYSISEERVRSTRGILSKRTDGIELYRVDDARLFEPALLRLVGKGNIQLITSDRTSPTLMIEAVSHARELWDQTRKAVEECRDRKRTRVVEFESQTT